MKTLTEFIKAITALVRVLKNPKAQTIFFRLMLTILVGSILAIVIVQLVIKDDTSQFEESVHSTPAINSRLEVIRKKYNADYVAVYVAHNGKNMLNGDGLFYFDQYYHSNCDSCPYQANILQNLPVTQFAFTVECLYTYPVLYSNNLDSEFIVGDVNYEISEFYYLRQMLLSYGTKSIVVGGIFYNKYYLFYNSKKFGYEFNVTKRKLFAFMTLEYNRKTKISNKTLNLFSTDIRFIESAILRE